VASVSALRSQVGVVSAVEAQPAGHSAVASVSALRSQVDWPSVAVPVHVAGNVVAVPVHVAGTVVAVPVHVAGSNVQSVTVQDSVTSVAAAVKK
jgi:hypothetical protein